MAKVDFWLPNADWCANLRGIFDRSGCIKWEEKWTHAQEVAHKMAGGPSSARELVLGEDPHLRFTGVKVGPYPLGPRQPGDDDPPRFLECALCGATELNVGEDDHSTFVRCPKCRWELLIHEG